MNENDFPINVDAPTALAAIDSGCWQHLLSAVDDSIAAWRLPCLATQSGNGCKQRTVVLRAVDAARRLLLFHTDVRSGKVFEIREHANVSLLFYDPTIRVQVVAQGLASVHTDDMYADRLWSDSTPASLKMYLGELPPGAITAMPSCNEPKFVQGRVPQRTEIEAGRRNFAAVVVSVSELEWLQLSRDGNYRARIAYLRDGADSCSVEAQWCTP
jgi:general stress protein 26